MRLDDPIADGETQPHAIRLAGDKWVEQLIDQLRFKARSVVPSIFIKDL